MKLNKICAGLGLGVTASCLLALTPIAQADSFTKALTGGTPSGDIRVRYETADDSTKTDADAFTVRTRLGYRTGNFNGFTAFVEMEDVSTIGDDDYNSLTNGKTTYATIADPEGTEMNRADITYKGFSDTTIILGRQRIIYNNARFIGNVGWRQNEQTYDGLTITNTSVKDLKLSYNYISDVNTITFGNDAMDSHLFNISYSGLGIGTITGYGYMLDYDDDANKTDLRTLGIRFSGTAKMGNNMKLLYTAEYADQSDYKDSSSATVDSDYQLLEGGIAMGALTAKIGYEVLGKDGTHTAFATPLATAHAHNGWADKFLTTPTNGLEDVYVKVGGKFMGMKLLAVYHDYEADNGGASYGDEINLLAVKKFGKNYAVGVKYASYDADTHSADTDKLMVWGQIKF